MFGVSVIKSIDLSYKYFTQLLINIIKQLCKYIN